MSLWIRIGAPVLLGLVALMPCQASGPKGVTPPADEAERGTLTLAVDLRETLRSLVHVREEIPLQPGPVILVYPKW